MRLTNTCYTFLWSINLAFYWEERTRKKKLLLKREKPQNGSHNKEEKLECLHNVYTPRESCSCLCDTWIREKNREIRGIISVQPCAFFSFPSILAEKFTQASLPVTGRSAATYDRRGQKPEAGVYRYRVRVSVECKRKQQTKRQQAKKFSVSLQDEKKNKIDCFCPRLRFRSLPSPPPVHVQSATLHTSITQMHTLGGFVLHRRKQDNTSAYLFCRWAAELAATWPPGRPRAHLNMKGSGSQSEARGLVSPSTCKHCLT